MGHWRLAVAAHLAEIHSGRGSGYCPKILSLKRQIFMSGSRTLDPDQHQRLFRYRVGR